MPGHTSDTESMRSDTSSVGSTYSTQSYRPSKEYRATINTGALLEDKSEKLTKHYLVPAEPFLTMSLSNFNVEQELHHLQEKYAPGKGEKLRVPIVCSKEHIVLSEEERSLLKKAHDETDVEDEEKHLENTNMVAQEFERYYGTSIQSYIPEDKQPYLSFEQSTSEMLERLNQMKNTNQRLNLASKTTLTEDIEQQFSINPLRVSWRQRKKKNAEERRSKLSGWFDMSQVVEIDKEQEKDLLALKMRRVWNPKQFYKKNSSILDNVTADGVDVKSKYFQIGTIQETKADFYSARLPKAQRKQTIVDELMQDHELRSYNKRKLKYAMAKHLRLKMIKRAKQKRRQK